VLLLVFGTTGQTQLYAGPTLTARPVAQPVGVATPFIRAQSGSELHTVNVDSAEPVVPSVEHVELAADDNVDSTQNTELSSREALGFNLASLGLIVGMLWNAARGRRPSDLVLATTSGEASSESEPSSLLGKIAKTVTRIDFVLIAYFFFWYLGNYYYNIFNKVALNTAGGAAGFPMTIAAAQLFFGSLYGIFLWLAPDARKAPKLTGADLKAMLPVSICAAGAHASSVFALGAGAVSFAQIVKAAEPAFAAVLGTLFYGKVISTAKWLCLVPVIGGVALASAKELDFAWSALIAAGIANLFAAVKGNENKKLMDSPGIKDRLGTVGNQFAVTSILAFLVTIPLVVIREGSRWPEFCELFWNNPVLRFNCIASGLVFYAYNELATMTIKKTNAVTQSVANTAKRVIVIVGVAIVLGESLDPLKLLGCGIGIGGVFLYSIIDQLVKPKSSEQKPLTA
jgi:solute carrier family 35 protein E1